MIRNEQGTVLIIAMILLTVLTFVGLAAIFSSSMELRQSGDFRASMTARYAAEAAIEAVKNDGFYATTKTSIAFPASTHPNPTARDLTLNGSTASGTMRYVTAGNPPPGYGFSARDSAANYFVIEATGTTPSGIQDTQEEMVARILPRSGG